MNVDLQFVLDGIIGELERDENVYCKQIECFLKPPRILQDKCVLINVSSIEETNHIVKYIVSEKEVTKIYNDDYNEVYVINLQKNISILINYGGCYFESVLNALKRAGASVIGLDLSCLLFW